MLVTKHAAELCALLVNDLHGELPSRIIVALLTKGRCNTTQLAHHTSLNPRQLRQGLSVLFQHNLLYIQTDRELKNASYDANSTACYDLARSGPILEVLERQYGTAERDLVQTLLSLGHARIADLEQAFVSRAPKANGHTNGLHDSSGLIETGVRLNLVLARLIQLGFVETVRPESFRNPVDVYHEIVKEVTKIDPGEKATSKNKGEHQREIADRYRTFRNKRLGLKKELDIRRGSQAKRRKLANGRASGDDFDEEAPVNLDPNMIVRVNHEKCLVELRNERLVDFAVDALGHATGEVYRVLLGLITSDTLQCRPDQFLVDDITEQHATTTLDIYDYLDESVNVATGIGKAPKEHIDYQSAEKLRVVPRQSDSDTEEDSDDDDEPSHGRPVKFSQVKTVEEDNDDDSDEGNAVNGHGTAPDTNGSRNTKVKFEDDEASKVSRLDQMRQHLLLLAENRHRFIRHCGTQGRGQWTVDFSLLLGRLRAAETDAVIEQSYGRYGLRLTRILREKGKQDEKMLQGLAFMSKADVLAKMLALQMSGIVDIQEVPKDNSRLANRTLFFWYFDADRTRDQLLDDVYKAMMRTYQVLQVERHKQRNLLSFVDREDVQGNEEEMMAAEHYNQYNQHLEVEEKLLGQVIRLDSMISILRDF